MPNPNVGLWNNTNNTYGLKKPLYNYVDNGDFEINQRKPGSSLALSASTLGYCIDRWLLVQGAGAGTLTGSQNNLINTLNQFVSGADPDIDASLSLAISATTVGAFSRIEQWIPNVKQFAGKWLTLSAWAFSSVAFSPAIEITQYFGTGGTPSAAVQYTMTGTPLISNTWTPIILTAQMASVAAKTLGSDGLHGTLIRIYPSQAGGLAGTIYFTLVQLEEGQNYTGFHKKTQAEEDANCRRFYQKSFIPSTLPAQNVATLGRELWPLQSDGANNFYLVKFPVVMQKAPTMVYYNPAAANALARNYRALNNAATTATQATNRQGCELFVGPGAGWVAGDLISLNWEAKGDLSDPA